MEHCKRLKDLIYYRQLKVLIPSNERQLFAKLAKTRGHIRSPTHIDISVTF